MLSKNPNPAGRILSGIQTVIASIYLDSHLSLQQTRRQQPQRRSSSTSEGPSKKIGNLTRFTKSRESWSETGTTTKFLEALQLFDRRLEKDCRAFMAQRLKFISDGLVKQLVCLIRSHAQKYFLKVQKSGTNEHLPPPRPKRKAAHPYLKKLQKMVTIVLSQPSEAFQSSSAPLEPGYALRPDSSSIPLNPIASAAVASSWTNNVPTVSLSNHTKGPVAANNCCSSAESTPKNKNQLENSSETRESWSFNERCLSLLTLCDQLYFSFVEIIDKDIFSFYVLPDFSQVYGFIGSVFDPNVTDQLQNLKKMDPIDVETVLLLMRNLSLNLTSPSFEEHVSALSKKETLLSVPSDRLRNHGCGTITGDQSMNVAYNFGGEETKIKQ
ncbi:hypothetical protein NC651_010624 [Populus alba x Populus x berolinensis]|nr:hypothetical protein NC651_010624 [Populus alba x Populus x berolinensis]